MDPDERSDALGLMAWDGMEGVVIPSVEGYGIIFTADPSRMIITVPIDIADAIDKDTPEDEAKRMLQPMFERITNMISELEESKGPE